MKEKAIYGLASTYKYPMIEYEFLSNLFKVNRLKPGSIKLDSLVGATLRHDYGKEIGRTDRNLSLILNDHGLFFKLIPETPLEFDTYKKVKKGLLTQCSCSYYAESKRDYEAETHLYTVNSLFNGNEKFEAYIQSNALLYEICLCEYPKNEETFCTTNKNDPRLKGIKWESETV